MKKKSIKKNYVYNVGYQVLSMIVPLITVSYISKILGADCIGQYSYINSLNAYFVLFATLGITTYGRREISYVQDNRIKRSCLFWETKALQFVTSGIAVVLYFAFALTREEKMLYIIFVFNILSVTVDITWFFQGMEEFGKIVLRSTIFKIGNLFYIFCFVREKEDFLLYVFGLTFFPLLNNSSLWFGLHRYIDMPDWKKIRPFRNLKTVLSLFVPTIAIEIYTVLDKTMLGIITKDSFENGYYELAIKMVKMALFMITALVTVMIPRISYHFQREERDQLQHYMYQGYQFVFFLGIPLCLGIIGCAYHFVPWFLGAEYAKVSPLMCVLSPLILAIGVNNLTGGQYLISTKRQGIYTFTVLVGAGTNFFLNLLLIPQIKSFGAAIASVIAESVIALVQLYFIHKEMSIRRIFVCSVHYWIAGFIMLGVLILERCFLAPTFFGLCLLVSSGCFVYLLTLYVIKDEFFLTNSKAVITFLKR